MTSTVSLSNLKGQTITPFSVRAFISIVPFIGLLLKSICAFPEAEETKTLNFGPSENLTLTKPLEEVNLELSDI